MTTGAGPKVMRRLEEKSRGPQKRGSALRLLCAKRFGVRPRSCRFFSSRLDGGRSSLSPPAGLELGARSKPREQARGEESGSFAAALQSGLRPQGMPAGADTRCLVSAISRRDLFFRPRSVASIPVPCPSTTATGLHAQQPCNAGPGEFPPRTGRGQVGGSIIGRMRQFAAWTVWGEFNF